MPGVTWTEKPVTATTFTEGRPSGTLDAGVYALFGMPIPVDGATVWADPTASYTERTVPASSFTEKSVAAVVWTEKVI